MKWFLTFSAEKVFNMGGHQLGDPDTKENIITEHSYIT